MRYAAFAGLVGWCLGGWLSSQVAAFVLNEGNWLYMTTPMGEDWVVCPERLPGEAVQRIKEGAATWNYERFRFTFAADACLSNGRFPLMNSVNQVDIGSLSPGVLANTVSFFFSDNPSQVLECDMRFNSAANWYTGTGTPAADQFDFWSVATHEMGHCLGLDHEDRVSPPPVMRSTIPVGSTMRQLTSDDLAGRNTIYSGSPGGSVAPGGQSGGSSGSDDGGGGGCAMVTQTPADAAALLAALGNILLPILVAFGIRCRSRRGRGR
ncbi:MAG: matrixin family metalloprotease [Candidatus Tectimicrobiota bacterium]